MLIDHGSAPVLISSELVDILGLIPKLLFKPLSVSGAFAKGKRSPESKLILLQYCRLHVQLTDTVWKSKVINAILGLYFLFKNHIVVDANL